MNWSKRTIANKTDKIVARQVFEELYAQYDLQDTDAAWLIFKNGWDSAIDELSARFEAMPFGDTSSSFACYARNLKND